MKLVSGRPLRELIAERTTVEQRIGLLHHVIAVADAIAYAHGRGIIHRDLKPANIIVGDFGETVVIDWGLAKAISSTEQPALSGPSQSDIDSDLTAVGAVVGTPTYMAPEQERGEYVDQRADVFAIGAMLWELCSLQKVPPGEMRQRHRMLRRANIDGDLIAIIDKALERDPALRYGDAGALATDLKAFKSGTRIAARRYSLLGVLAHWTRRHRALSLVVLIAVVLLSATLSISLLNISRERAAAVSSRETAMLASAAAFLDRDPTRASSILRSVPVSSAATMLRARVKAAGVAEMSIELPARLDFITMTPSQKWIVASTADRALYVISPDSGSMRFLADGLTEPSAIAVTDDMVYFVQKREHLSLVSVPIEEGQSRTLMALAQIPLDLVANSTGVFWSTTDGLVSALSPDGALRVVARNATQFGVVGANLVTCDRGGTLRIKDSMSPERVVGVCLEKWPWAASEVGFVVPTGERTVTVMRNNALQSVPLEPGIAMPSPRFSRTGMLVTVDAAGMGRILRPTESVFEYVRLTGRPTVIAASGDYAAWGFRDGGAKVVDVSTKREWSIQAHPEELWWLAVLPHNRLVTCGRRTLRFWTLPSSAPTGVGQMAGSAYNVAFNRQGDMIFDGNDGRTSIIQKNDPSTITIHMHDKVSYGVSWCGPLACSTGWDTRLICTDIRRSDFASTTFDLGSPGPWITGASDHCYVAAASGNIYEFRNTMTLLYKHEREPYRISVSHNERFVASGDWSGNVRIFDNSRTSVIASRNKAHDSLVTNIVWSSDAVITSGADGWIRLMSSELVDIQTWHPGLAVRYLVASDDLICAGLEDGSIWFVSRHDNVERRFNTDTTLTALAMSHNGRLIAAGTATGELIIFDKSYVAKAVRIERGRVTCAAFDEDDSGIIMCSPSGQILRLSVDNLFDTQME
jgi:WD40 repeat protein